MIKIEYFDNVDDSSVTYGGHSSKKIIIDGKIFVACKEILNK